MASQAGQCGPSSQMLVSADSRLTSVKPLHDSVARSEHLERCQGGEDAMGSADQPSVTAESKLNEVLAQSPSAGQILVQAGGGWVNKKGDLYAQFPDLTVAQYAEMNSLEVDGIVARLQAAAESDAMAKKAGAGARDDYDVWRRPALTI